MNQLTYPGQESANLPKSEDLAINIVKNINNDFSFLMIFLALELIGTIIFCEEETFICSSVVPHFPVLCLILPKAVPPV